MIKSYFKGIENVLLKNIASARTEILIAVAWFTNHDLFNAVCEKLIEGVTVTLCLVNDEINNRDEGINLEYFISKGGVLYFGNSEELMHHKFCIIDNSILLNGSYNWTYYAEKRNRENIIIFKELPTVVSDFKIEFDSTISKCDKVSDLQKYLLMNKPQDSSETASYISYDMLYQSEVNESTGLYDRAMTLAGKALKIKSDNKECRLFIKKLEDVEKRESIQNSKQIEKEAVNWEKIVSKFETDLIDSYISTKPDRQKALLSAKAIYQYEKEHNFALVNAAYSANNPGYIMMIFGHYQKAEEFFRLSKDALGQYNLGVLNLLHNDGNGFSDKINKAFAMLGEKDIPCLALYVPKKHNGIIEYSEKKLIDKTSKDTISLKAAITTIKMEFNI